MRCNWYGTCSFGVSTDFYSRTSCEVQLIEPYLILSCILFLLTHLLRGATAVRFSMMYSLLFLLTHLLRGATAKTSCKIFSVVISTHAPLARCNTKWFAVFVVICNFYSRTSCEVQRVWALYYLIWYDFYSRTSCEVQHLLYNLLP